MPFLSCRFGAGTPAGQPPGCQVGQRPPGTGAGWRVPAPRGGTDGSVEIVRLPGPVRSTQAGAPPVGDAPARRAEPCMPTGGAAGTVMSGPATCGGLGIDPFSYLRDVLSRVCSHPARRVDELLPDRWQER